MLANDVGSGAQGDGVVEAADAGASAPVDGVHAADAGAGAPGDGVDVH